MLRILLFFPAVALVCALSGSPAHAQTVRLCNHGAEPLEYVATFRRGGTFHRTTFATIDQGECLSQQGQPPMDFAFFRRNADGHRVNLDFQIDDPVQDPRIDYDHICIEPNGEHAEFPLDFGRNRWQTDICADGEYPAMRSFTVVAFQDTQVATFNMNGDADLTGWPVWPPVQATAAAAQPQTPEAGSGDPMLLLFPDRVGQSYTIDRVSFTVEPGSFAFSPHSTPDLSGQSDGVPLSTRDLAELFVAFFDFEVQRGVVQDVPAISPVVTLSLDDAREVLMYLDLRQRLFYLLELDAGIFLLPEENVAFSPALMEFANSSRFTHSAEVFGISDTIASFMNADYPSPGLEALRNHIDHNDGLIEHWRTERGG